MSKPRDRHSEHFARHIVKMLLDLGYLKKTKKKEAYQALQQLLADEFMEQYEEQGEQNEHPKP